MVAYLRGCWHAQQVMFAACRRSYYISSMTTNGLKGEEQRLELPTTGTTPEPPPPAAAAAAGAFPEVPPLTYKPGAPPLEAPVKPVADGIATVRIPPQVSPLPPSITSPPTLPATTHSLPSPPSLSFLFIPHCIATCRPSCPFSACSASSAFSTHTPTRLQCILCLLPNTHTLLPCHCPTGSKRHGGCPCPRGPGEGGGVYQPPC
jgi:hypothetical protein